MLTSIIVLCLFSANCMRILAIPLPQYDVYPAPIVCVPCCFPCDSVVVGVDDNNIVGVDGVAYPMGDIDPFYNSQSVPSSNNFPVAYGVDPNAYVFDPNFAPVDWSNQQLTNTYEPTDDSNQPSNNTDSSDTDSVPVPDDDNTGSNDSMHDIVHSALSELAERYGDSEAGFKNAVNDFVFQITDTSTP